MRKTTHLVSTTRDLQARDSGRIQTGRDKAVQLIVREMRRLKKRKVGSRDLRWAKDYICGQIRLGLESTTNQMIWMGENMMSHGAFIAPETTLAAIEAVTSDDVIAVAREVFVPPRTSLAMVSPSLSSGDEHHQLQILDEL